MGSVRGLVVGLLAVAATVGLVAAALWFTNRLLSPGVPIVHAGPLAIDAYQFLLGVLAVALLALSLVGWLRGRAAPLRAANGAAAAELIRLVSDHPAGSIPEGEGLEKHLEAVVGALRIAAGADGALAEIVEQQVVVRAFASGDFAPYRGLRSNVAGSLAATALEATSPITWTAPETGTSDAAPPETRTMMLSAIRQGTRNLGILRISARSDGALDGESSLLETTARYIAASLWKAPARAYEDEEQERTSGAKESAQSVGRLLSDLIEAVDEAVWVVDPTKDRVLQVNAGYERIFGLPAERLLRESQAWLAAVPSSERKRVEKSLPEASDEEAELSYVTQRADSTQAAVRHRILPLRDEHGVVLGVGHVVHDQSERQLASGELEAWRRRFAEATETGPVIAYAARPGGDYGLTFITPNVQGQLGYAAQSFLGDPTFWSAHLHPDDQTRVFEGLARLFEKGRLEQEYRFRHADGTYRVLRDVSRVVRSPEGEPVEIVGYFLDMTERRRAEEGLQYSLNRIKELQESRTRLLNNIAHDLGSPLTPIGLQLHLLKERPDLPEGSKRGLDIISRNVEHVSLLIQDLRDVARLEAGQLKIDVAPIDAAEVVANAVESFHEGAKERGIELASDVKRPLPVNADAQRLNQVLFNFLTNALKFTPQGGRVAVTAMREGSLVTVRVKDSGRGLTRDEMERLFKPFSQVHDRSQMKEKGTGLGLYICKGLVEKHGGRIWVESAGHGKGSTFGFSIPVRDASPIAGAQESPPTAESASDPAVGDRPKPSAAKRKSSSAKKASARKSPTKRKATRPRSGATPATQP